MDLTDRKAQVFFGILAIVALAINSCFLATRNAFVSKFAERPTYAHTAEPPLVIARPISSLPAKPDPAEEHRRYVAKYVTAPVKGNSPLIAIAAVDADGQQSDELITALSDRLQSPDYMLSSEFFKPEFISDGLFETAFENPSTLIRELDLAQYLQGLVVARQTVSYSQNPELQNVTTATMRLDIRVRARKRLAREREWTLTSSGAGFNQAAAFSMAEERLLKAISVATNLTLNSVFSNSTSSQSQKL